MQPKVFFHYRELLLNRAQEVVFQKEHVVSIRVIYII